MRADGGSDGSRFCPGRLPAKLPGEAVHAEPRPWDPQGGDEPRGGEPQAVEAQAEPWEERAAGRSAWHRPTHTWRKWPAAGGGDHPHDQKEGRWSSRRGGQCLLSPVSLETPRSWPWVFPGARNHQSCGELLQTRPAGLHAGLQGVRLALS